MNVINVKILSLWPSRASSKRLTITISLALAMLFSLTMPNAQAHEPDDVDSHSGETLISRVFAEAEVSVGNFRGDIGTSSMVLDAQGYPVIAFSKGLPSSNGPYYDLYLIRCNDQDCLGGDEVITQVSTTQKRNFFQLAVALSRDGYPVFAMGSSRGLLITQCHNATCANLQEEILNQGYGRFNELLYSGGVSSLAVEVDFRDVLNIGFGSQSDQKVGRAQCKLGRSSTCVPEDDVFSIAQSWFVDTVDLGGGGGVSLLLYKDVSPGLVPLPGVVMSYNAGNGIRVRNCNKSGCTTADLEPGSKFGSLAMDAELNPAIAYILTTSSGQDEVRVVRCGDAACSSGGNETRTVDSGRLINGVNMVINRDNNPVIAYNHFSTTTVRIAACTTPTCSAGPINIVQGLVLSSDGTGIAATGPDGSNVYLDPDYFEPGWETNPSLDIGFYLSLHLDNNDWPILSHGSLSEYNIWAVHCGSKDCSSYQDLDNDFVDDTVDNCPALLNPSQSDVDGDGLGDLCDPDADGDSVPNDQDALPLDPRDSVDSDGDGTGDNTDNCLGLSNPSQSDVDGDGLGDLCDGDADGDSVPNDLDALPLNPNETVDTDGDGIGNNADQDDDGDSWEDTREVACGTDPLDPNSVLLNTDGSQEYAGGRGFYLDYDCYDPDDDNDGFLDADDAFPLDVNEWLDTDGDRIGNNADPDDDGDGQTDANEITCGSDPLSAGSTSSDFDLDGLPDCVDPDDDNDSYVDVEDDYPLDPTRFRDVTPPSITLATAVIQIEATAVETFVELGTASAIDLLDGAVNVTSDAPAAFPLGTTTVTYTAADKRGNTATATQTVTVVDTTAPVITSVPENIQGLATGENSSAELGQLTATDIFDVSVSNDAPAVFPVGTTVVTWTATDTSGNSATATQSVTVVYQFGGFLAPVVDGGLYKANRVLPIKFMLSYADGSAATTAQATLVLFQLNNNEVSGEGIEVSSSSSADSGNTFRYSGSHYIYNLNTSGQSAGQYRMMVTLNDGGRYSIDIALK